MTQSFEINSNIDLKNKIFQNFFQEIYISQTDYNSSQFNQPLMAYAKPSSFNTEMMGVVHFFINKTDLTLL